MTNNPAAPRAGTFRRVTGAASLAIALGLAACSPKPGGPAGSTMRVYAVDLSGGAKVCKVSKAEPEAGKTIQATINVANDGGWCGLYVHQSGPRPFAAGLLTARATHGTVTIHDVGDDTRIDYTPDRGFTGSDSFSVELLPGDASINLAVTVTSTKA